MAGVLSIHHHHHRMHQQHPQQHQHLHHGAVMVGGGPSLRPHSTPATLLWLEENYEMAQGVCVPRNTLYLHYVDFCSKHSMTPVNAASFGKVKFKKDERQKLFEFSFEIGFPADHPAAVSAVDDAPFGDSGAVALSLLRDRHPREFALLRTHLLQERTSSVSFPIFSLSFFVVVNKRKSCAFTCRVIPLPR